MKKMSEIRNLNLKKLANDKIPINYNLPLFDSDQLIKSKSEIIERCLILNVLVSCSFGFPSNQAIDWLVQENLLEKILPEELEYINNKDEDLTIQYKLQVESLYAFAWILNLRQEMNLTKLCDNKLISVFPNLKTRERSNEFINKVQLRPVKQIVEIADLCYCFHWAITEKRGLTSKDYLVIERRKVLEWVLSENEWNEISMDT